MDPALVGFAADTGGWLLFGAVALGVLRAVTSGRWIPRETHDAIVEEKDRARDAAERRAELSAVQVDKLLAYAKTADAILRKLPRMEGADDDLPPPPAD